MCVHLYIYNPFATFRNYFVFFFRALERTKIFFAMLEIGGRI